LTLKKLWSLKDKNILIVDDFPTMRSMLRTILLNFGANNIMEARNGEDAIEKMVEATPEIVLCDYNLGEGKDGQQVLEEAKQRGLLPHSSIFLLTTAENTTDMVMGAFENQPDDYIIKPFAKAVLQMRIRKLEEKKEGLTAISKAIARKDYQKALLLCDERISENSKSYFELQKIKGEILMSLSSYDEAKIVYDGILTQRDIPWASKGLGLIHYYRGQYDEAKQVFFELKEKNKHYLTAYDWLAKVEEALGNSQGSQQLLMSALAVSPKAILRQKALAEIAFKNGDLDTSEQAYKYTVRHGKNSCFKHPSDYGGLAKVYLEKSVNKDAEKIILTMKKEFQGSNDDALLQAAVIESTVYKDLGKVAESHAALDKALELFSADPGSLCSTIAVELAQACFAADKSEQGKELIRHVVRNHHDDADTLKQVQTLFDEQGLQEEGAAIINSTRSEVVAINNDGVDLLKSGKLQESIGLFTKAARAMPENVIINLNAAQSFIIFMQQSGVNERIMLQTQQYLDRVRALDAGNNRYKKLMSCCQELSKKNA